MPDAAHAPAPPAPSRGRAVGIAALLAVASILLHFLLVLALWLIAGLTSANGSELDIVMRLFFGVIIIPDLLWLAAVLIGAAIRCRVPGTPWLVISAAAVWVLAVGFFIGLIYLPMAAAGGDIGLAGIVPVVVAVFSTGLPVAALIVGLAARRFVSPAARSATGR